MTKTSSVTRIPGLKCDVFLHKLSDACVHTVLSNELLANGVGHIRFMHDLYMQLLNAVLTVRVWVGILFSH